MSYLCSSPGPQKIDLTVKAVSGGRGRVKKIPWHIHCLPDNAEMVRASFYQGPLIVENRYYNNGAGQPWLSTSYRPSHLIKNRQTILSVKVTHFSKDIPEIQGFFVSETGHPERHLGRRFLLRTSRHADGTEHAYWLPRNVFSQKGKLRLVIDPQNITGEFGPENNTIEIPLNDLPLRILKPFKINFVPITSRAGQQMPGNLQEEVKHYVRELKSLFPLGEIAYQLKDALVLGDNSDDSSSDNDLTGDALALAVQEKLKNLREQDGVGLLEESYHGIILCHGSESSSCPNQFYGERLSASPFGDQTSMARQLGNSLGMHNFEGGVVNESSWPAMEDQFVGETPHPTACHFMSSSCNKIRVNTIYGHNRMMDYYLNLTGP